MTMTGEKTGLSTPTRRIARPARAESATSSEDLRRRYQEYRRRQGAALPSLIPRDAVRALYRASLEEGARSHAGSVDDAFGLLARFCEALLPLPPFEVWKEDYVSNRAEYLDEARAWGAEDTAAAAVTVCSRTLEHQGRIWRAELHVREGALFWSGHIAFSSSTEPRSYRTGEIFREARAADVRSRFVEFDSPTLAAFLRSALP